MKTEKETEQPNLFEAKTGRGDGEKIVLYALGEFQSRGFQLIDRELALDRLRGAFKRSAEGFGSEELPDEKLAQILTEIGAQVKKVPSYVAKHPYRITIGNELAIRAFDCYKRETEKD
ncbi:MAG: hypothetical protein R2747_02905 [Pyrinomonadaceae bacterium]